ncbi:retrovirus-related pol polyprotein from transposon TNT 1-94 [Tanacetum coccineum]
MESKDNLSLCSDLEEQEIQKLQMQAKFFKENSLNELNALKSTTQLLFKRQHITQSPLFQQDFAQLFGYDLRTFKFQLSQHTNDLETQLNAETLYKMDSKSALSVISVQFHRFIHSDVLKPVDPYSSYVSSHREVRKNFKDYTHMDAQTFHDTIIQNMNSIEQCMVKRASHRQELTITLNKLNERQLQIQQCEVQQRAALANLIANLTLDTEENKTILRQLKKANASLTQELTECKTNLDETNSALGEATSCQDSCLIALQNKQTELEKYIAFKIKYGEDILLVQIYVDDIIFGSINLKYSKKFEKLMHSRFQMSLIGEMKFFLGLQIHQSPKVIFINQAKYALEILKKHKMDSCHSIGTPLAIKPKLDVDFSGEPVDQSDYHSKIGSLMYLTSSRPDLVQEVCYCARYQARPTQNHLKEVKRIFKYLKGTINMGLWYLKDSGFELIAFLDADHAGCIDTRKNTFRGIQFLGDKLISWMSKKQNYTAMSSAEAKYVALSASYAQVENGIIELYFVRTEYQLADMFTKALPEDRFKYLVKRTSMRCLTPAELEVLANDTA